MNKDEKNYIWRWCLVGNIIEKHPYGEEHEIRYGSKHFSGGTKVYIAPAQWCDGMEKIVVLGLSRYSRNFVEVVISNKLVENFRLGKVYQPALLRRMLESSYIWWDDSEKDKESIITYIESRTNESEQ
ncbi:hypothetical protein [Lachnoclostridium sp. MSJ-17]|uniref:hypothetical protein n=1 Tax=Lachnoclostridium sp. MSJ-17 TaxID=2841516 RepID=UPI001C12781F|nr:hypothetical protein [Lachnoclostridium sp. MSJ-17]MBU5462701.1 hypothetical protein [Lachnoclostridium sp. MSJ-17]